MSPFFSILVPTIGRKTLLDTIKSIENQSFKDYEVIVSDDTSEGVAYKLLLNSKYFPKIRYVKNKAFKKGPAGNKNNALIYAKGQYLVFLDDDDIFYNSTVLEKIFRIIKAQKEPDIVVTPTVNQFNQFICKNLKHSNFLEPVEVFCKLKGEYTFFFKRTLLEKNNIYFNENLFGGESCFWIPLFMKAKNIFYSNSITRIYFQNNINSVTRLIKYDFREKYKIFKCLKHLMKNLPLPILCPIKWEIFLKEKIYYLLRYLQSYLK